MNVVKNVAKKLITVGKNSVDSKSFNYHYLPKKVKKSK